MPLFWELTRLSAQRQITYRAATLAGLATNLFFGLLRASVMIALYGARRQVSGISLEDAIIYTGISQAIIAYLSLFGWYEIIRSIYSGQIAADLLKPMPYFNFWMAQDFGRALVNLIMRGLPIILFYAVLFDISYPMQPGQWLALLLSLLLAWMVSFAWRFLINLPAYWVPDAVGIARLGFTLSWFLSGFLMPLRFFPEWFSRLCYLTPFPYLVNTPIEIYLGLHTPAEMLRLLLAQTAWFVVLMGLGQWVLRRGVHRLVIQGG